MQFAFKFLINKYAVSTTKFKKSLNFNDRSDKSITYNQSNTI